MNVLLKLYREWIIPLDVWVDMFWAENVHLKIVCIYKYTFSLFVKYVLRAPSFHFLKAVQIISPKMY